MYLFLTNHRQDVLTSTRKITARKRWGQGKKRPADVIGNAVHIMRIARHYR
jgi:hypothetical protein